MATQLKIAYILPSLDSKAPIFLAKRLSDYFIEKGYLVKVFYFDAIEKVTFNCSMERIDINKPIDFDYFDIIHSHMFRPDKYISKFSKTIKKAKTISTLHCNIAEDLAYSYGKLVSFVFTKLWISYLKKINSIVQINDYLFDMYKNKLPHSSLIYNGISISEEKDDYSEILKVIEDFRLRHLSVICSYSGIVQRKGLKQLLELLVQRKDLAYVCIGNGTQKEELKKFCEENKITDRVYFSDFKKNPYNIMKYADLFAIPSYSEGFSLALLEAGSIGSSVICSDIPAFACPFSIKEVSFFKLNDIESLSRAVDEALVNKEKKQNALTTKIQKFFTEEIMFNKYDDLYHKILS